MKYKNYIKILIMVIYIFLTFSACKAKEENYDYIDDLLFSQLDWKADYYLSSLEEGQEDVITIKDIHYGDFCDRDTLNIKTQISLYADRVSVYILPYVNEKDNILYVGNTVYQGVPAYSIELYHIQDNEWISSPISDYDLDSNFVYALTDNTLLHIIEITYNEYMNVFYNYKYTLYWNSYTGKFIDASDSPSPYLG